MNDVNVNENEDDNKLDVMKHRNGGGGDEDM